MELNAMLSWCGAFSRDKGGVGTDLGGLITSVLLDDVGIVLGACSQTAFNEQLVQVDQSFDRNAWYADRHASTNDRVQHPRGYQCHYACGCLDVDKPSRAALLASADLNTASVQRMPTIVNFNFLSDMGRMAKQLPRAGTPIYSSPPSAAGMSPPPCIR